jgi:hypothetical protein
MLGGVDRTGKLWQWHINGDGELLYRCLGEGDIKIRLLDADGNEIKRD